MNNSILSMLWREQIIIIIFHRWRFLGGGVFFNLNLYFLGKSLMLYKRTYVISFIISSIRVLSIVLIVLLFDNALKKVSWTCCFCKLECFRKDETHVSNINVNYIDFTGKLDHENIPIYKSNRFKMLRCSDTYTCPGFLPVNSLWPSRISSPLSLIVTI
jgi:hypothetical protein